MARGLEGKMKTGEQENTKTRKDFSSPVFVQFSIFRSTFSLL